MKTFVDHYNGGRPFDEHLAVAELRVEGADGDHVPTSMALEDVVSDIREYLAHVMDGDDVVPP